MLLRTCSTERITFPPVLVSFVASLSTSIMNDNQSAARENETANTLPGDFTFNGAG